MRRIIIAMMILALALGGGCYKADATSATLPPMSVQQELNKVYDSLPQYPGSTEVRREFVKPGGTWLLRVHLTSGKSLLFEDPTFEAGLTADGWKFQAQAPEDGVVQYFNGKYYLVVRLGRSDSYIQVDSK